MAEINLKRGFNINLVGETDKEIIETSYPTTVAIKPTDFVGIKPKLYVAEGDKVKIGTPLFYSKNDERIKFTSPASGVVKAIIRGKRRVLEKIIIETDGKKTAERLTVPKGSALKREKIIDVLLRTGLFPLFIQRPFAIIANPDDEPRDIFISAMNTAPLSPDPNFIVQGEEKAFQKGLDILKKLTSGKVHLTIDGSRSDNSKAFTNAKNIELHKFTGPHPAGNVGVQIHHIAPIKRRDDIVWTCSVQGVILIGRLFEKGKLSPEIVVAVAGSMANDRKYFKTILGASIITCSCAGEKHIEDLVEFTNVRYISGDVLSGKMIDRDSYIGFYDNLITIIPERDKYEFLGWIKPGFNKASRSRSFLSGLFGNNRKFVQTTALNGGHRPFVVSGIYEGVLPMDILPVYLVKSILAGDIEEMEGLGIYEVAPEDLALCEYIDPSKNNIQQIVRHGLDLIFREG